VKIPPHSTVSPSLPSVFCNSLHVHIPSYADTHINMFGSVQLRLLCWRCAGRFCSCHWGSVPRATGPDSALPGPAMWNQLICSVDRADHIPGRPPAVVVVNTDGAADTSALLWVTFWTASDKHTGRAHILSEQADSCTDEYRLHWEDSSVGMAIGCRLGWQATSVAFPRGGKRGCSSQRPTGCGSFRVADCPRD
jgi:hypothetical protein